TGYHKHAAYMIENGDLPGFTTRELRGMSALVLNQKGNLRKTAGLLDDTDFAKAVLALRLAVLLMHTRADLDVAQTRVRMKSRIELELPTAWLAQHPTLAVWLDKERDAWDAIGMPLQLRTQAL
ncbi:MAG TPA: Ppx/GppA family phosphatase, partial [Burkholderiaceae bacterium]